MREEGFALSVLYGDEGIQHGVRMKISSWQRHDPNAVPAAGPSTTTPESR